MHIATERLDDVTGQIVDSAYRLHCNLGPGLLETVYELVLARDLRRLGLQCVSQTPISFAYDGLRFENCFRIDLLVESAVIVEVKSVENLLPVHSKQLLTYLRLMDLRVGLLINFGAPTLKEGLHRIVNRMPSSAFLRLPLNGCPTKPEALETAPTVNCTRRREAAEESRIDGNVPHGLRSRRRRNYHGCRSLHIWRPTPMTPRLRGSA